MNFTATQPKCVYTKYHDQSQICSGSRAHHVGYAPQKDDLASLWYCLKSHLKRDRIFYEASLWGCACVRLGFSLGLLPTSSQNQTGSAKSWLWEQTAYIKECNRIQNSIYFYFISGIIGVIEHALIGDKIMHTKKKQKQYERESIISKTEMK